MTRITPIDRTDRIYDRLAPAGAGSVGWPTRALMLSLICFLVHCGDDGSTSTSSGTTGGAGTTSGGASSSGGSASGGDNASGGARISGGGGTPAGTGGSAGTSGSTSGGGTAPTGGADGNESSGAGAAATGGASGSGGKAGSAGTSTGGDGAGGATAGGSDDGGATTGGATTGGSGEGGAVTGGSSGGGAGGTTGGTFTLTSPGWENMQGCAPEATMSCAPVPIEMTRAGGGNGTSPQLAWTHAPEGTRSFALLFQDLSGNSVHWVLWNIPSTVTTLPANIDPTTATPATPAGSQQCSKDTAGDGYYGPGAPCNVYEITVYALSIETFSPTTPTDEKAVATQLQALGSSILGIAVLRGRTDRDC